MKNYSAYTIPFSEISLADLSKVGGKNSSLGELFNRMSSNGIPVPNGFATTAFAFEAFLLHNQLHQPLQTLLNTLDRKEYQNLKSVGAAARALMLAGKLPDELTEAVRNSYEILGKGQAVAVAVRSSATAEDLPQASFAGQHESYLNISGFEAVLQSIHRCFASLYTDRAIKYRETNGFAHEKVALSVGVQLMIRSDLACSGVGFTLDPESGFRNVIHISGVWGLGENIVQGTVSPDSFLVFKPTLQAGYKAILQKKLGAKGKTMIYGQSTEEPIVNIETPPEKRAAFVLNDIEITQLANWMLSIETHYQKPMDIEWAKDGITNQLFILQARPETVHSQRNMLQLRQYTIIEQATALTSGDAIGSGIATGTARVLHSPEDAGNLNPGEIVVTSLTSPDWDPVLQRAAAIVTDRGGRTSHASIVAREMGVPAIVGCGNATSVIKDGDQITVSCCEGNIGHIYPGILKYKSELLDFSTIEKPQRTKVMLIAADPDRAFQLSSFPNDGIGLMRMEFIITHSVQVHPMALLRFSTLTDPVARAQIEQLTRQYPNKEEYFIDKLAEGIGTIAAAFYPKDVIVRMSDFKTNEYAHLIGGAQFEPEEENPMIGFRGASRYYHDQYRDGFRLECEAIRRLRDEKGLTNIKVMIPFCRTVAEGKKVLEVMRTFGLVQGQHQLEVYVMAEIPSNVLLAEQFAELFDGFSIGSNDLTQLTLGVDRDSALVSSLFSELNEAALEMIKQMIAKAKKTGTPIGLCGQAASDYPEFAQLLVKAGIDSISFTSDALLQGIQNINIAERAVN